MLPTSSCYPPPSSPTTILRSLSVLQPLKLGFCRRQFNPTWRVRNQPAWRWALSMPDCWDIPALIWWCECVSLWLVWWLHQLPADNEDWPYHPSRVWLQRPATGDLPCQPGQGALDHVVAEEGHDAIYLLEDAHQVCLRANYALPMSNLCKTGA